jgi:hypothetical protein
MIGPDCELDAAFAIKSGSHKNHGIANIMD